jgi:3-(3-hydroxy-phenyl)propionate hydroxylase
VEDALRLSKLEVLWGHRLQALSVEGGAIRAEVATLEQVATGYPVARSEWVVAGRETIRPAYVIGADGYDSAVRRMAGIEMDEPGGGQVFSVYEIEAGGELPGEVRVMLDPELTSVYWPLEDGRSRWGFQMRDASGHEASMARLEQLIAARAPWCTARPTQIYWSTVGGVRAAAGAELRHGGVWLAGDAAHQAGPVGVHSMNSGLVEARELAARIARILREGAPASHLEEFAAETHGTWQRLLDAATRPGHGVRALPGADPWVRSDGARIARLPPRLGRGRRPAAGADRPRPAASAFARLKIGARFGGTSPASRRDKSRSALRRDKSADA